MWTTSFTGGLSLWLFYREGGVGSKVDITPDQPLHFSNNPHTLHNYHSLRHEKRAEIRRQTSIFGHSFVPGTIPCSSFSVTSSYASQASSFLPSHAF